MSAQRPSEISRFLPLKPKTFHVLCRIDTLDEVDYFRHGGILQYVLRNMMQAAALGPVRTSHRHVIRHCVWPTPILAVCTP